MRPGRAERIFSGALEVARVLADAPGPIEVQAHAIVLAWSWMERRRVWHLRDLAR